MYKVYAERLFSGGRVLIYMNGNISDDTKALSPKLTMTENNAGEFTIKLPPTNAGYDFVDRLDTLITVEKDDKEIWKGRVISIKEDFRKNKTINCEGELAYLNDTTQPQREYLDMPLSDFYSNIINNHNLKDTKYGAHKTFRPGIFTAVSETLAKYSDLDIKRTVDTYTNYETTMKVLNDKFLEPYGGYFHIRKVNGLRYLDYISDTQRPASSQVIEFGSNLLDFTKSCDATDFATVLLPLGAKINDEYGIDDGDIDKVQAYLTIDSVLQSYAPRPVFSDGSAPYIVNEAAVNKFGWIEKVVHFDEIEDPYELYLAAVMYMENMVFENLVLEVNAVDLGYLGADYNNIQLSEKVRVKSKPHNLDMLFPVKKIDIPLDNPANTSFTIGNTISYSMSAKTVSDNNDTNDKLDRIPSEDHTLMLAKKKAAEIIDAFTMGYITIIKNQNGSQELYVTDTSIPERYDNIEDSATYISNLCQRYWRWNLNGLAYYDKNDSRYNNPKGLKTAITMEGAIVADFLTVGKIQGGKSYWDLSKGIFHLDSGVQTPNGTIGSMESTLSQTSEGLTLETKRVNKIIYGTDTEGDFNSTHGLIGDYTSKISASADSLKLNFNKTLYGNNGTFENPQKGSIVYDYRSSINLSADNLTIEFNKKLYGTNNDSSGGQSITSMITVSANNLTASFDKKLYGPNGNLQSGIVHDFNVGIDGLKSNINKTLFGNESGGSIPKGYTSFSSAINQAFDSINLKVSSSDLNGKIESYIKLGINTVSISTNTLTVNSGNFRVDNDGTVYANHGFHAGSDIVGENLTIDQSRIYDHSQSGVVSEINFKSNYGGSKFLHLRGKNILFATDSIKYMTSTGGSPENTLSGKWHFLGSDGKSYAFTFWNGLLVKREGEG